MTGRSRRIALFMGHQAAVPPQCCHTTGLSEVAGPSGTRPGGAFVRAKATWVLYENAACHSCRRESVLRKLRRSFESLLRNE